MKNLMMALMLGLNSFHAFGGDLYFICSTNYGESDKEEVFYIDKSLDADSKPINESFYQPDNMDRILDITFIPQTRELKAYIMDVHGGGSRGHVVTTLKVNIPVVIAGNLSCRISD